MSNAKPPMQDKDDPRPDLDRKDAGPSPYISEDEPDDADFEVEDDNVEIEHEDDHSGADCIPDYENDEEIELSPPAPGPVFDDKDHGLQDNHYDLHDDDTSPPEHEDDHSGVDFTDHKEAENTYDEHVHPGLAAALDASYAYAQGTGTLTDNDEKQLPDDSAEADSPPVEDQPSVDGAQEDDQATAEQGRIEEEEENRPPAKDAAIAAAAAKAVEPLVAESDAAQHEAEEKNSDDDEGDDDEEDNADKPMSLRDHLTELRKRLLWAFLWTLAGFMICYPFAEELFTLLFKPLMAAMPEASKLIYTSPPEAFFTFLKVAFVAGIFCASPLVFYQVWAFMAPGLYKEEKLYIVPVAFFSAFFFICGGAFCYFLVFPLAFEFFMSYNQGLIQAMPALSETLSFVLQLLLAFGLVFELPLFVFFLARLGIVTADMMRRSRRYAILVMFIVAAILTPPDVLSQLLMAGPLILLYETSIFIARVFGKEKPPAKEDSDDDEHEKEAQPQ